MDLDFYVTGTLKYLLGPPGLAFMYVRKELIPSLVPTVTGWFAQANPFAYDPQHIDLAPTARRFESGSPPVPNVYAAMPGIQLLSEIGMANVEAHIRQLTQALLSRVQALGIRAKTPADSVGPLVVLQSTDSNLLLRKLAERDVIASNRHDGLRLAFHVYNTMDEVETVVEILKANIDLLAPAPAGVGGHD
jgi:selenocysteine lyase/cysteine desulfurase